MQLTPEEVQTGKDNFNEALSSTRGGDSVFEDAVALSRRSFIKGAAGATAGLGSIYFGYDALKGDPVRVGFIGTGDEGNVLLTEHPPAYMDIVAIADLRPTNRQRAFTGDGNSRRTGLDQKLGRFADAETPQRSPGTEHQIPDTTDINHRPAITSAVDQALEFGDHPFTASAARA